jgi:5-methylcytosine-specific restriction endonuclease McrA
LCGHKLRRRWTYNKKSLVPHPRNATIDHIVPMSKGGADAQWNVQSCCLDCNGKKSATAKGQLRFRMR